MNTLLVYVYRSMKRPERPDRKRLASSPVALSIPLVVLLAVLALAPPVRAHTWRVPSEQPSIRDGLAAASAGDTVLVDCGTYAESGLVMTDGVVLRSEQGDADCVTVDAMWQGRGLSCVDLGPGTVIEGLTFTNGIDVAAGAVFCSRSSVTFRDCAFVNNVTGLDGAGFYCNESAPLLERCFFQGNVADTGAGGGFCSRRSDPVLRGCVFADNRAGGWGGGFYASGGDNAPLFEKCVFDGNSASLGGAVACNGTTTRLVDCEFIANEALLSGGGLYLNLNAHVVVEDSRYESNAASAGKAALVAGGCTILLRCCELDRSLVAGGGLVTYDDENCDVGAEDLAWGDVKAFYK